MLTMVALLANDAEACGGFGCDLTVPVLQNAERIVFAIDHQPDDTDVVEMHVQITYEGAAEDFAWIVPVPADPDLFVTSAALFAQLQLRTAPIFQLQTVDEGNCGDGRFLFAPQAEAGATSTAPGYTGGTGGVHVVAREAVGPYDTVTLQATSVDALMGWLDANHYAIPANSEAAIAPYVAPEGAYFLALRLQKDKDVGDLTPLGLRYTANKAIIPIQLTSVSATPDMRVEVYVFGPTRAVPESYLHVQINEAAVDWWNFGQNYPDVITQAANEAGGHAFATDYYGDSSVAGPFFFADQFDEAQLRGATDPQAWMQYLLGRLAVFPPELVDVVVDQLGMTEDQAQTFINCYGGCVDGGHFVNGVDAATDALMARVVVPLQAAQRLVDEHSQLTRMTSSLDAVEMTVDPVFVLNPDMRDSAVSSTHIAQQVFECHGKKRENANRRLVLANGIEIALPSQNWLAKEGMTELEYIAELGDTKALIIEQTGATGQPVVQFDHTNDLKAMVADFNGLVGCGCDSSAATGSLAGLLAAALLVIRRR